MNDIILSSLLNLFALYNTRPGSDRKAAEGMLSVYLTHHFGVRDIDSSLEFYANLVSHYDENPDIDRDAVASGMIRKLQGKLSEEDRVLMALRYMEILHVSGSPATEDEFRGIAGDFNIDSKLLDDLVSFVIGGKETPGVRTLKCGADSVRTLYLEKFDTVVFSCFGDEPLKYNDIPVLPGAFMIWQRSGVLKPASSKPLYYYNALAPYKTGGRAARPQLKFRGNGINFRFQKGAGGIHNFSFNLYGGELVAIMGGSGTGKTTLLSLLSGTLSPQAGEISINGHSIREPEVKSLMGFVPQDDLLISELTVYENLYFTARLCFDGLDDDALDAKVMAMLHDLGLDAAKDLKAGSPINKFISGGQRKRLNIALELIREPDVLFLDEPTSGLSSSDTMSVMNLLREQAYKGRLIITNIHQPNSDVFKLFDRLWVLDRGGYPVYDGNPIEAITYFKRVAGYADAGTSSCPTCGNLTPEIILDILDDRVIDDRGQITDQRKITPEEWHGIYLKTVPPAKDKVEPLPENTRRKPSAFRQMLIFLKRNVKAKLADRQWLLITLLEAPVLVVICALLTHYAPPEGYTVMDNGNLVTYFFMSVIVATFLGMSGSAEEIIKDRALLRREKFLNLSYRSYIWSKILFMAGVAMVQTFLFLAIGSLMMGIHCLFFKFWLILFASELLAALTGLLLSQCLNSVVAIYITVPILLIPQILLCGLVVKFSDITPHSTTGNVAVIGDFVPSRWAYEAMAVTFFSENDYERHFFDCDKEKYQARYYELGYVRELKSQLGTMKDRLEKGKDAGECLTVIENSIPLLMSVCGWEPYRGDFSYDSLGSLFSHAEEHLYSLSCAATREADARMDALIEAMGKENVVRLKHDNYNLNLEGQLVNADAESMCRIVHGHIVPNAGFVFLDPVTRNGRAPFYSSVKLVGDLRISTLWFNLLVMLLMAAVCSVCLLEDFPGRKLR